jgi:hypothetical protein
VCQSHLYTQPQNFFLWNYTDFHLCRKSWRQSVLRGYGFVTGFVKHCVRGEVDPFIDEAWLYLNGHVNTHHKRYWSADNLKLIWSTRYVTLKVVWCAVSETIFSNTVNSEKYIGHIQALSFENLSYEDSNFDFFQQDCAITHRACSSCAVLRNVLWDRIISHSLCLLIRTIQPHVTIICGEVLKTAHIRTIRARAHAHTQTHTHTGLR